MWISCPQQNRAAIKRTPNFWLHLQTNILHMLYKYTVMRAKIIILREMGRRRVPITLANKVTGEICLYHERPEPSAERTVPVLHILDGSYALPNKRRKLFEPRLIEAGSGSMKFSGLEFVDGGWYAQEWCCDFDY